MNVTINGSSTNTLNTTGSNISNGDKGDITVNGNSWIINNIQLSNKFIYGEIPNGVVNGINPNFTSKTPFVPETLRVYINGLRQSLIKDYLTSGTNQVLLFNSLETTDSITIDYIKA